MLRTFVLRDLHHVTGLTSFIAQNWLAMAKEGKPLAVTVSEYKAKRSGEQNKRYWALLNEIAANAYVDGKQFSAEAWHEHMKRTYIGCEETPGGGTVGISTTTLGVGEFADYMTRVEAYAQDVLAVEFAR
jgi:hypothetical protein